MLLNLLLAVFFLIWWGFDECVFAWFFCLLVSFCNQFDSLERNTAWDAVFLRACEHTNRSDPAASCWRGKNACMALILLG